MFVCDLLHNGTDTPDVLGPQRLSVLCMYMYTNSYCRAASVSERSEAIDRCLFEPQRYIYLFAVARWLLCLLSDYKSATCSER